MICKTNAQVIIQGGGGGGDDMVLYHVTQTINGNNCTLSLTTYNGEATDNYWVGTKTTGNTLEMFLVDENGTPVTLVTKTITSNGTYNAQTTDSADGYSEVVVNVPQSSPSFGYLIATDNGEYDAEDTQFDGWSHVSVGVVPALVSMTITQNGTYRAFDELVEGWDEITVNVPTTLKTLLDATHTAQYLFASYTGSTISGILQYNDTENVTQMTYMFHSCRNLQSLDLFDTHNAIYMSGMLYQCSSLTTIPLFNTSNTTDMGSMLSGCSSLISVPAFDVSSVTYMGNMFYNCSALAEIHMTGMKVNFDISASTQFTQSALVEILNNLATVSSTKTLTMGATNLAKLTSAQRAIATNKGWTLA